MGNATNWNKLIKFSSKYFYSVKEFNPSASHVFSLNQDPRWNETPPPLKWCIPTKHMLFVCLEKFCNMLSSLHDKTFEKITISSRILQTPGLDSRSVQILMACSFTIIALWSRCTYSTSFESSKLYTVQTILRVKL